MSFRPPISLMATDASIHPARLGKYTLTGVLGEGAMGTVYKGYDPVIQRAVAVKSIRPHLFENASLHVSAAERFRNEAKAAGRLTHPGIVGVYEYGEDDGGAFIAMEYVEGHGLNHYIAPPARLPEPEALSVMMQLLEALHCAHEQGVWHRDIKPNNIIVTADGRLKIADFGIARIESADLTQMTVLIGSPGYIAPERYTGEAPDRRVDIFSCGVLLYQMLTGVAPFAGTDTEAMYKVLHTDPLPPSRSAVTQPPPECWDAIVAKALAKRPEDRYATAREFREALFCAAPWPIPPTLSSDVIDGVERRLADEAATVLHVRARVAPTVTPPSAPSTPIAPVAPVVAPVIAATPPVQPSQPARPMSKECAEMAAFVAGLAAKALASEERRSAAESAPMQAPAMPAVAAAVAPLTPAEPRDDQPRSAEPNAAAPHAREAPIVKPRTSELLEPHTSAPRTVGPLAAPPRPTQSRVTEAQRVEPRLDESRIAEPRITEPRTVPPTMPCAPPTLMVPVTRRAPLTPEVIAKAQRVLAGHIGPIARLIVKNAVSIATTREQFYTVLADLAADGVEREQLLGELSRIT